MKIKIGKNLATFKKIVAFISKLGTETNMTFTDDGMSMLVTGDGNTATGIKFKKDFFEEFEGEGEYGIILDDLNTLLKKVTDSFEMEEDNGRLLVTSGRMKAHIPLITDVGGFNKLPELDINYQVKLTMLKLTEALEQIALIKPEEVVFQVENKKLKLTCKNGLRTMEIELMDTEEVDLKLRIGLFYLQKLNSKSTDVLTLNLKSDTPLLATYEKDGAEVKYFIAPRAGGE